MHGNDFEWCWDSYGLYSEGLQTDPIGPPEGTYRVLRGSAYWGVARNLRSAFRLRREPELRDDSIGLRVVRRPRRPVPA